MKYLAIVRQQITQQCSSQACQAFQNTQLVPTALTRLFGDSGTLWSFRGLRSMMQAPAARAVAATAAVLPLPLPPNSSKHVSLMRPLVWEGRRCTQSRASFLRRTSC